MYAQYSSNKYELTLGNLYLLQGMGLSMPHSKIKILIMTIVFMDLI